MELLGFMLCSLLFLLAIDGLSLFRRRTLPPGPCGLPLVGNLFEIGPKPHESLAKLAKKHGPLMTIRLGSVTSVVASSPEMAREILQKNDEACSGRPIPDAVTALDEYNHAVLWMPTGAEWRIIRRALNTYLTHPQKLDTLRGLRRRAVQELVQHVKEANQSEEAVDIGKLAFTTALNQMSNTCVSENVADFTSNEIRGFQNAVKTLMEVDGKFNIADIFPWLKLWIHNAYGAKPRLLTVGLMHRRLKHRQSKLPRDEDFLDSLLDFSQENEAEFNCKHIKILLVVSLFMENFSTSTRIMAKLRQEVSDSVGSKGKIEESEILELPYLQAVAKETMRLHLSVPFLVPHKTETSVKLKGFEVPPNTQILVNAWAIARDTEYWENPLHFMPERFLKSEADFKGQHFSFLPFGSGRRMCPGIPLAQRVVSLMIASLVYHFDWKLPHSTNELDMNDIFGITLLRATPLLAVPMNFREGITGQTE
ncbi:hypothetical protein RJ639_010455 [Escallonia herrerae]|uniref:Cytochrome P450 n=1 Tax=Escallonia herrerae TaxID=1293975 RepID=A0AA88VMY0_9ASTE|nr:hypothetical protein RJ639_010455 [Escallonia herrerae]